MDYIALANAALEKRARAFEERKAVLDEVALTDADKWSRVEAIDAEMAALEKEARGHIETAESEAETRALNERAAALAAGRGDRNPSATEWRNGLLPTAEEYRALLATSSTGEAAVPTRVAKKYRELLVARSAFLNAPGLVLEPFTGGAFVVPQSDSGSGKAGVVQEGAQIPATEITLTPLEFRPKKYAERVRATFEMIDDSSVNVTDLVSRTLVKRIAASVDGDGFEGSGTDSLVGVTHTSNCTSRNLTGKQVTHDDLITEYAAILAAGGEPTVIWASLDQWPGLVAERAAADGHYLNGQANADPAKAAWGVPILPAARLGARKVVIADAREVMVGLRQDVRISRSDDVEFDYDIVNWKITYRVAGVKSNDNRAVRLLVAAAS